MTASTAKYPSSHAAMPGRTYGGSTYDTTDGEMAPPYYEEDEGPRYVSNSKRFIYLLFMYYIIRTQVHFMTSQQKMKK